ncbi:MAG: hypothetical protein Q9202_001277 [Teloschistes flavicans]
MSFEQRPPDPSVVHSRRAVQHAVQFDTGARIPPLRSGSNYGSDVSEIYHYNSESSRIGVERLRRESELVQREIRRREEERLRELRVRDRIRGEQEVRRNRAQDRITRRESDLQREQEIRKLQESQRQQDLLRLQLHQEEEASRREDRGEISRKRRVHLHTQSEQRDRRTTVSEPKHHRLERSHSAGVPDPAVEEPRSLFSRFSSLLISAPAEKATTAPQVDAGPREDVAPKVEKAEPLPKSTQHSSVDLEGYFLQPAEDSQIQMGVMAISDSIDQHVYNHYGNRATSPPGGVFLSILQMNNEELRLPKTLIDQASFRLAAIRRSIASTTIREIAIEGNPSTTFLPKEIVALLKMAPAHGKEKSSSVFCRLAANILRLGQNGESPAYTEFQRAQVKNAADRLHKQLSVLANRDSQEAARRDQLEAIMTKAAQIGILLLLQPATHQFNWSVQFSTGSSFDDQDKLKSRPGPFVIFPALIRTGDTSGRELRRGQIVCKPEYLDEDDMTEEGIV